MSDTRRCPQCGQPISEEEYNRQCAQQIRRDEEELERIARIARSHWGASQ